ncbi:MAG: alpha/beta hydrolase [Chitinophagaceae bacterium]
MNIAHPALATSLIKSIPSRFLGRVVDLDIIIPSNLNNFRNLPLLLVNDGQDLAKMPLLPILEQLWRQHEIAPLLVVGIHAGPNRKMEYGVQGQPDYLGRGALAGEYQSFVSQELIPFLEQYWSLSSFTDLSVAGFSLGGLSAFDMAWTNKLSFKRVGVFSGSLWWRYIDQNDPCYSDQAHRIMHGRVRETNQVPSDLQFFFQCGALDEKSDRNKNGVIDSIDDTLDLIQELALKGVDADRAIHYLELQDGKHDVPTWAKAMPYFLKWGWG